MTYFKRTNKIKRSYEEEQFDWEIPDFFSQTSVDQDAVYESPVFTFAETPWILRLSLLARTRRWTLCMRYEDGVINMVIEFEFGFKKANDRVEEFCEACDCFEVGESYFIRDWRHSEFLERKQELALKGSLVITCTLKQGTPRTPLQEPPPMKLMKLETLSEDFKNLFSNTDTCDVTLHVGDRTYNAHKVVLMTRSPVFAATFYHDSSEKQTGIITIPDCDANSFQKFLEFLYCGKLEDISFSTAIHLYSTSDKYDIQELKSFCVEYMERYLAEDNVCDVILLADMYDDSKLAAAAQDFFNRNARKIVVTAKWESLFKNNFHLANKFIIEMTSKIKIW